LSGFLLDLHQSLAHQGFAKILDISTGMPAVFANPYASRSQHISSPKIVQLRLKNTTMAVKIDNNNFKQVGRIIHFHRKKAGLSRIDLAMVAGVGKTVIYDIEHGKETLRIKTLLKILNALNITMLLDGPIMEHFAETEDAKS